MTTQLPLFEQQSKQLTPIDAVFIIEGIDGDRSEDEILAAYQYLVDTGIIWGLQGFYGRTAARLIQAGHIQPYPRR